MRKPSLSQFLQILFLTALAANLILFLVVDLASVAFPYDLDYGEAFLADQARRAATGQQQYKPELGRPPYVIDNYGPLYPLLVGGIWGTTNLPLLQAGRALSLLAGLLAGTLVGMFAWRLSGRRFSAVLAAGLFLGNLFVTMWAPLARVDMMGLALSLAGLWFIYRKWRSWAWLSLATLCLVAAVYTRQTYIVAAPLGGTIWLWHNDRRRSVWFTVLLVFLLALIFLLLNWRTRGGFYLGTVSVNAAGAYDLGKALARVGTLAWVWPFATVLAGLGLAAALRPVRRDAVRADRDEDSQAFLRYGLLPYTMVALLSALTVGKIGADVNYLLEPIAALSIWASLGITLWLERRHLGRSIIFVLLTAQILLSLLWGWKVVGLGVLDSWYHLAEYDRISARVRAAAPQGPILGDYLGMSVLAGQPAYFQPFDYRQLYAAGQWDPSELIGEINARRFPLIILTARGTPLFNDCWIPAVVEAIDANYTPSDRVGDLVLYEPSWESQIDHPDVLQY